VLGCGALYLLVRWEGQQWGRGLTECHAWLRGGFGGEDGGMKAEAASSSLVLRERWSGSMGVWEKRTMRKYVESFKDG